MIVNWVPGSFTEMSQRYFWYCAYDNLDPVSMIEDAFLEHMGVKPR